MMKRKNWNNKEKKEEGHNSNNDSMTDVENDDDDRIENMVRLYQQKLSKQTEALSDEAYGVNNVKSDYTPKVITKTDDQLQII
jgi:hypothetical protein